MPVKSKRIKMPKRPKMKAIPKAKPRAKQPKPKVIPKAKPKKPFLRRVRAKLLRTAGGGTIGTQEKQIRDLGLMDEDEFKRLD